MLARVIESAGLTTLVIGFVRPDLETVKPPRALWIPFPFGFALGKPDDPTYQHNVLRAAFAMLDASEGPVLVDLNANEDEFPTLQQATAITAKPAPSLPDPANEITALRGYYEQWVEAHSGRTGVGLSRIPQRRFRGIIRMLQTYVRGERIESQEIPQDTQLPQFLRWCSDDLKAYYYEARMQQRPHDTDEQIQEWFWGETGTGQLLRDVRAYMLSQNDPNLNPFAAGIAR